MNTPNIGWLYYKDYLRKGTNPAILFQEAPGKENESKRKEYFENHFAAKNKEILNQEFSPDVAARLKTVSPSKNLCLTTTYPGLTLGTGYTHETGEQGEFKLGFFFDHVTGYPCIPGSTVKGCLRSMFPQKERKEVADKDEKYNYLASVIRELTDLQEKTIIENKLGKEFDQEKNEERKQFVDLLEREIFDGEYPERNQDGTLKTKDGKIVFQPICVYGRDIFFDAYPVSTNHPPIVRSTYRNKHPLMSDDYITPHINRKKPELSPFTNPIPLMFLKILPKVAIQFQFDLKDGILTKEQKELLFRRLLLDFGIGAKTNVGYGQFEEGFSGTDISTNNTLEGEKHQTGPQEFRGKVKRGIRLTAIVTDQNKKLVQAMINGQSVTISMSGHCPENGVYVKILITDFDQKTGTIRNVSYQGNIR